MVRSAGSAGTDSTLCVGAGMQHVFPIRVGVFQEADAATGSIGTWIRTRTEGASAGVVDPAVLPQQV